MSNEPNSAAPPNSWNSIDAEDFPGNPPIMASFFHENKSNATTNS